MMESPSRGSLGTFSNLPPTLVICTCVSYSQLYSHGILIEQNYDGGDLPKDKAPGTGVPISGLTIKNITGGGGVNSKASNVAIVCGNCTGWTWNTVTVDGGSKFQCQNAPAVVPAGVCA